MTLEAAIQQLIELGEKDPLIIARKIEERNDKDWLAAELVAIAEDLIAEIARHRLSARRRSAQIALRPGDAVANLDLRMQAQWVHGEGWVRAADITVAQAEKVVAFYQRLATGSLVIAAWWKEVIDLMKGEGAKTLGKLKAELPPLPGPDELEAA